MNQLNFFLFSNSTNWGMIRGLNTPLDNFSLSPQNQKGTDVGHLGSSSWSIRHPSPSFRWTKNGGTTLTGARVSRKRPVGRGWFPPEKIQNLVWSWNLLYMLEMSFSSFISQKMGEISIFGIFLAKCSISAYVLLKSPILRFGHIYNVTVTSYVGCLYLFWYMEKGDT